MYLFALPEWVEFYLDYPGLELWKFINLAIFSVAGLYILRQPVSGLLNARRESIRRQIDQAQQERDVAEAQLKEADALLARLPADIERVRAQTLQEAQAERERQTAAAEQEIERLKAQAAREVESARKVAYKTLQEFLAMRSLEVARQSVVNELQPQDDVRLIEQRIGELRRATG